MMHNQMSMHGNADGLVEALSSNGFVRSESMDIQNDPRFFTGNVIDKRLAAVSGLSVVSTLMVGIALGECYGMKKDMEIGKENGIFQIIGFVLMNLVLFSNIFATYVAVAQVYFTYRLMTAGATGFEMAASFYLNPNVAFWRHAAVKWMLQSLPLFLLGGAFRMLVKFDADMPHAEGSEPKSLIPFLDPVWDARIAGVSGLGLVVCCIWLIVSMFLFYVNSKHAAVFKERYAIVKSAESPLANLQTFTMSNRGMFPDI